MPELRYAMFVFRADTRIDYLQMFEFTKTNLLLTICQLKYPQLHVQFRHLMMNANTRSLVDTAVSNRPIAVGRQRERHSRLSWSVFPAAVQTG